MKKLSNSEDELKNSFACIKNETRVLLVFKLRVCGKVPFSLTLKSQFWHECSARIFHLNLSDGLYSHSRWSLTACNIAKRTVTS